MDSIYLELCMLVVGEKQRPPRPSLLRVAHFACRTYLPVMGIFVATRTGFRKPGETSFSQNSPLLGKGMALDTIDCDMSSMKQVQ
jgi:hypothetical protein